MRNDTTSWTDPVVLLMNDHQQGMHFDFPEDGEVWTGYDFDNTRSLTGRSWARRGKRMWDRYHTQIVTLGPHERYYLSHESSPDPLIPVSIFRAIVTNSLSGDYKRPPFGDEYVVIFVNAPSHTVFQEIILKHGLHVCAVALIRQGGFSQQLHYEQYIDVPKWLINHAQLIDGEPEYFFIDSQGQSRETKKPLCKALDHYEYVGGPVDWGWRPCRAYARLGVDYVRRSKIYVNGSVIT